MGLVDSLCRIVPRATALRGRPSGCRAMGPLHRAAGIWAGNPTECPEGWHFPSSASGAHPRGCGRTRGQNTMGPVHFGSEHPPCWSLRGPVLTAWVAPPLVRPHAHPHLLVTVHLPHAHSVHGPWPSWKLVPFRCCNPGDGKIGVLFCLLSLSHLGTCPCTRRSWKPFPLVRLAPVPQATFGSLSPAGVPGDVLPCCYRQRPRKRLRGELDWGCRPARCAHVGRSSRALQGRGPSARHAALWDWTGRSYSCSLTSAGTGGPGLGVSLLVATPLSSGRETRGAGARAVAGGGNPAGSAVTGRSERGRARSFQPLPGLRPPRPAGPRCL